MPRYRSFQYRLLQRAIVTNVQLYKWNLVDTENCYFCEAEPETLTHLFIECPIVRQLWTKIFEYMEQKYDQFRSAKINSVNLIKSTVAQNKNSVINLLVLVVKQYIYRQRCLKETISFIGVKKLFQFIENTEKYIAIKNGKLEVHIKKWRGIQNMSQDYIQEYICKM